MFHEIQEYANEEKISLYDFKRQKNHKKNSNVDDATSCTLTVEWKV